MPARSCVFALIATAFSLNVAAQEIGGVLDQAVITDDAPPPVLLPGNGPVLVLSVEELTEQVESELEALEEVPRAELEDRAESGERAAQVVLGTDFAREASLLGFAPAAANDALSDAARWYSLAASSGFPGAPSLDQAGVRFFPIRIQREIRR